MKMTSHSPDSQRQQLLAAASTRGLPTASLAAKTLPERPPAGCLYLLTITPYIPAIPDTPRFHRRLDDLLADAYTTDIKAHEAHGCWQEGDDPFSGFPPAHIIAEAKLPDVYRAGMFAPRGCGASLPDGSLCCYQLCHPHVMVVSLTDMAEARAASPADIAPELADKTSAQYHISKN